MSTLTDKTVAETYGSLLHLQANEDGLGATGAKFQVEDGLGNPTPVRLSDNDVDIGYGDQSLHTYQLSSTGDTSMVAGDSSPDNLTGTDAGAIYLQSFRNLVQISGMINLSGSPVTFDEAGEIAVFDGASGDDARMIQHHGHLLPASAGTYSAGAANRTLKAVYADTTVNTIEEVVASTVTTLTDVGVSVLSHADGNDYGGLTITLPTGLAGDGGVTPGQEKTIILMDAKKNYGSSTSSNLKIDCDLDPTNLSAVNKIIHVVDTDYDEAVGNLSLRFIRTSDTWVCVSEQFNKQTQ